MSRRWQARTTTLLGRLGGLDGRSLRTGDRLPLDPPEALQSLQALPRQLIPDYANPEGYVVRVILGPQEDRVAPDSLATFLTKPYTVGNSSDRMGARLDGPALVFRTDGPGADILSEGIATGAIQVPANGQPIVLLAGHQTTGGYAKIATVIAADLWQFAQARPGATIRFREVTPAEARDALAHYRAAIDPGSLLPITTGAEPMSDHDDEQSPHELAATLSASPEERAWNPAALEVLLSRAAATGITNLTFETATVRLHLWRRDSVAGEVAPVEPQAESPTGIDPGPTADTPIADGVAGVINAPVLGIFYRAAKPDQPPLVEVGDRVAAGQTVGLIEVMKTFYEVTAERPTQIVAALVENGAAVQYGQPLFTIAEAEDEPTIPDADDAQ